MEREARGAAGVRARCTAFFKREIFSNYSKILTSVPSELKYMGIS